MSEAVFTPCAPRPIGPYSQAIRVGNLVFASGQIPLSPVTNEIVGTTAPEQARQVLANLGAVFEAGGASLRDVAKTTIFLVDLGDFAAVNDVYGEFFTGSEPPARSTVQVSALPRGVKVEIEAVAVVAGR